MQITREHNDHIALPQHSPQYWGFKDENGQKILEQEDRRGCLLCRENSREMERLNREIGNILGVPGSSARIYTLLRKDFLKELATYNSADLNIDFDKFPPQASIVVAKFAAKICLLLPHLPATEGTVDEVIAEVGTPLVINTSDDFELSDSVAGYFRSPTNSQIIPIRDTLPGAISEILSVSRLERLQAEFSRAAISPLDPIDSPAPREDNEILETYGQRRARQNHRRLFERRIDRELPEAPSGVEEDTGNNPF